jgi:transcriptional regulator with XRE-family HTH domain
MSGHQNWSAVRRAGNPRLEESFATTIRAGLWLPELRRQAGLTQEQLAARLGVTQSWVSQIENESDVRLSTLVAYVAAVGGQLHLSATLPGGHTVDLACSPPDDPQIAATG